MHILGHAMGKARIGSENYGGFNRNIDIYNKKLQRVNTEIEGIRVLLSAGLFQLESCVHPAKSIILWQHSSLESLPSGNILISTADKFSQRDRSMPFS